MSAMTAPIGWRRTLAAICSGVGGRAMRASASSAEGAAACRGARGIPGARSTSGRRVQAVGVAEEPRFERVGAVQAAGDACEDPRDIGGAEAGYDGAGVGEGAPADRGGEFLAVVDQLADEAEQVGRAAGLGGRIGDVGRGGHGRDKNMRRRGCQGIFSSSALQCGTS